MNRNLRIIYLIISLGAGCSIQESGQLNQLIITDNKNIPDPNGPSNHQELFIPPTVQKIQLSFLEYYINSDCTVINNFYKVITKIPEHGIIKIFRTQLYTDFPEGNQRYKCNVKPILMPRLFYVRDPGFIGDDSFSLDQYNDMGGVSTTQVLIHAR